MLGVEFIIVPRAAVYHTQIAKNYFSL